MLRQRQQFFERRIVNPIKYWLFIIDEDLNQEVVTAKAVEFISDDYGSNEVASEENETNLSSADSDDGNEESEFPVHEEKEEREPSEVL